MADIVERLIARSSHWKDQKLGWLEYELYDEAAQEILALRERVAWLREVAASIERGDHREKPND